MRRDSAFAFLLCALLLAASPGAVRASWLARADSLYALAGSRYDARDYSAAARRYEEVITHIEAGRPADRSPYSEKMLAHARFLLGHSRERREDWAGAVEAYSCSIAELPEIFDAVRIRLAHCYCQLEEFDEAVAVYRDVIDGERTILHLEAVERLADCYRDAGDLDMALQWYRVFLSEADGYNDRARAHYKIGLTYRDRGDPAAAAESFATAVSDFPRSRHAYDALREARELSRAFADRYHQGLVLYNRREYRRAAEFFAYHLKNGEDGEWRSEATYFLGRCHQRLGHFRTAAKTYGEVIDSEVDSEYYDLAWEKLAFCLRVIDRFDESLEVFDRYVERHPEREAAPEIVWQKARQLEEKKRWEEALEAFRSLAERYPDSDRASDALFRAGLCLFKLERFEEADAWFAELFIDGDDEEAARALFWAGKSSEVLGRNDESAVRYREAAEVDRDSFYGRRALARLAAMGVLDERARPARARWTPEPPGRIIGGTGEFHDFAVWLAGWHGEAYVATGRAALLGELLAEPGYVRGETFLAIRMRDLAEREFAALESDLAADPRLLDALSSLYERAGLRRRAIRLAERILESSPADGVSGAPTYLRKKICPVHFEEVVVASCEDEGIDPNLYFSLIRQESLFEVDAVSWVGARGLSQIMPGTGRWIADRLGAKRFRTGELLDPETNVRFGAYYLSLQLEDFAGDVFRALAAYNGGPENAARWWEYGGARDSDVFVEDIGFSETADYVRRVYLYGEIYRDTYGDAWSR
jgi:soluble lytic murein transglycosylase